VEKLPLAHGLVEQTTTIDDAGQHVHDFGSSFWADFLFCFCCDDDDRRDLVVNPSFFHVFFGEMVNDASVHHAIRDFAIPPGNVCRPSHGFVLEFLSIMLSEQGQNYR
jgi:hypothetical protein